MSHSRTGLLSFAAIIALLPVCLAVASYGVTRVTFAAERPLSADELDKIAGWIAEHGETIAANKMATDILGLTNNDQTISSRAIAVKEPESDIEIHQIGILDGGRGYLAEHFHQDQADVYWADKNLVLLSALTGTRAGKPAAMSFAQAEAGFSKELAWWVQFADKN
jgi:hypothetical protein